MFGAVRSPHSLWALVAFVTFLLGSLFLAVIPAGAQTPTPVRQLSVEKAFPNLSFRRPVFLTAAGDGSDRIFVVLQEGRIMVFPNDPSAEAAKTFLDIRDKVLTAGNEEGLLGLAFAPDYAKSGAFYVYYSAANPRRTLVSRFKLSDQDQADPASETVLLEIPQPYGNHKGGMIDFGPDGYLYVGVGDGGSQGDPDGRGQDTSDLLADILRLDVSKASGDKPYSIPSDNPFVGKQGVRPEIWAYGLRNPWRFSFDSKTGHLLAGDVGQNTYEEVDRILPGRNYGWSIMEGSHCFKPANCNQSGLTLPIVEYSHGEGCSISGGYVYYGKRTPALESMYIYADYCSGRIWGLRYNDGTVGENILLARTDLEISSFGIDQQGELYIMSFDGNIYRFVAEERAVMTPVASAAPSATAARATAASVAGPTPSSAAPTATSIVGGGSFPTGGVAAVLALGLVAAAGGAIWLAFRLVRT